MKRIIVIFFLVNSFLTRSVIAQDSLRTLSTEQVIEIVKQFHPIIKQADIQIEKAKADITVARGLFDPLLYTSAAQKTFDGISYYNYVQPEISIPTWYGIEVIAGAEYLTGDRTDPRETLGKTNYIGFSIPLAKNLLMDKRRAVLQQAKVLRSLTEQERRSIINDLLLDATTAYWQWVQQYQVYLVITDAVKVSERRLNLVRNAFINGDRAALDTTEALAQLQTFQYLQNDAQLGFINAGISLTAYLWQPGDVPYNLPASVTPANDWNKIKFDAVKIPVLEELLTAAQANHPDLRQYNFKLDFLEIERKLKFQGLLPTLNFRYNNLGKGYNVFKTASSAFFENNYQYGFTFGIPLRLSQGRGEYRQAKLKITETKLDLSLKQVQVQNKVKNYYNELITVITQNNLQERNYRNYQALLRGEEARFFNGESSLFLVNSRESKVLEAAQKLAEIKTKYYKTVYSLQWAAGLLGQ
jgi:outer membrane protein TolC